MKMKALLIRLSLKFFSLLDGERDVSDWELFKGIVGVEYVLTQKRLNYERSKDDPSIVSTRNLLISSDSEGFSSVVEFGVGSKIIIDKVIEQSVYKCVSYLAVGRVFKEGRAYSFEHFIGMVGILSNLSTLR